MANLTLVIADDVLKRARKRAIDEGTSVNAVVREHLDRYASRDAEARAAMKRLVALARSSSGRSSGPWTRDEIHEDRGSPRG